jgi:subtilisin family serine protease
MVGIRPLSLALLMFALAAPASASAAAPTRIIVKRAPGLNAAERAEIRSDAGVRLVDTLSLPRTEVVSAPGPEASQALRDLNADRDVVYAEVDHTRRLFTADPYFSAQWAMTTSRFSDAWAEHDLNDAPYAGGLGQTIAVIDSGVDLDHEDLQDQVTGVRDFVGTDPSDVTDRDGHGTAVSGTIAAARGNGKGIAGAAPQATIMALRVVDAAGNASDSRIAEAIDYLQDHPEIRIVNLSLGAAQPSKTIRAAIHAEPDKLFVAAAGNGGADAVGDDNDASPIYPCNTPEPNVVCVGASTQDDRPADYSNYGARAVDLFAPGDDILAPLPPEIYPDDAVPYRMFFGTSFAAPYVSGAAALVLEATTAPLTATQLKQTLMTSTEAKPEFAGSVSGGRLDADVAVTNARDQIASTDDDGDGWADRADACAHISVADSPDGCPLDTDWDTKLDAADNCPEAPNAAQADLDHDGVGDACDPDLDGDGRANGADNCPSKSNPTQVDADRDGVGDACDATPRGLDVDHDGKAALDDACPTVYGTLPNGCPKPVTTPAPPDGDHDGRLNSVDACPTEPAATPDGCPVPAVTALSTTPRKRAATITVRTSRAATVQITIERKKGRRWVRVSRRVRVSSGNRVTLKLKHLRKGRYRAVVVVSSNAGAAAAATKRFRVR